jgi:deoxyribonuclease-4
MGKKHKLLLGAHMSIAGGLEQAIIRGESIGCTTIQIFTKSNRQWFAKKISQDESHLFHEKINKSSIQLIVAHASYLINLGSPHTIINKKSVKAVIQELERCELLKIPYLVLHPGSGLHLSEKECIDLIAKNLNTIFEQALGETVILLENMAGQGSSVCHKFEHIADIIKQSSFEKRLGVCFDTCHAFAAGYDLRTAISYEKTWQKFDDIIGLNRLKVIHVNDSKKDLNSHIDRHENIGEGKLGLEAFKLIFNDKRFFDIPKILETPKDSLDDDVMNMTKIKEILTEETKKILD